MRPEIVVFNDSQAIEIPGFLYVGTQIILRREQDGRIKVSRFQANRPDKSTLASNRLVDLIEAVDAVGGGYLDVLDLVRAAKGKGFYEGRIAINARPRPGRSYFRDGDDDGAGRGSEDLPSPQSTVDNANESFEDRNNSGRARQLDAAGEQGDAGRPPAELPEWERSEKGFFGKMWTWFRE